MTVAFFSDNVELGGAELSLVDYFRALPALGMPAMLLTPREGPLTEAVRAVGGACHIVAMPELVRYETNPNVFKATGALGARAVYFASAGRSIGRLAAALRAHHIALLHTNALRAHLYGAAAARLAGRPVVWHVRDILVKPWHLRLFRTAGRAADAIICVSEPARAALATSPALARKSVTIHNAIHLPTYQPAAADVARVRDEFALGGCFPVIALVGQVTWNKGHSDLIAAMPAIVRQQPTARLLIVGDSLTGEAEYKAHLRELIAQHDVGAHVTFTGFRADVAAILGASDVAAAPSWQEPYPRTVMEAFAAGVPVVATRVGGIPELVRDGATGLLVAPHAPGELAAAVLRASAPETRARLVAAARRVAAAECGVAAELGRIAAVYERVLRLAPGSLRAATPASAMLLPTPPVTATPVSTPVAPPAASGPVIA